MQSIHFGVTGELGIFASFAARRAVHRQALAQDNIGQNGATNLRQTLSNLNRSTTNFAEDTDALKHNFFFRGFFKRRGFLEACERQTHAGTRTWLQASKPCFA